MDLRSPIQHKVRGGCCLALKCVAQTTRLPGVAATPLLSHSPHSSILALLLMYKNIYIAHYLNNPCVLLSALAQRHMTLSCHQYIKIAYEIFLKPLIGSGVCICV